MKWKTPNEAFRIWRSVVEERGVLVLQLPLGKGNVRGFSAWDSVAPLIAANTAYNVNARIFTLIHEYEHILTRTDAACYSFIVPSSYENELERWCERFAASFLLPADTRRDVATKYGASDATKIDDPGVAREIANRFKVSIRATSLRLQELGMAPPTLYGAVEQCFSSLDWNDGGGGGRGQAAVEKRVGQLGLRLREILLDAASTGRLNHRDLSDYLGLTTGQVDDLADMVAER